MEWIILVKQSMLFVTFGRDFTHQAFFPILSRLFYAAHFFRLFSSESIFRAILQSWATTKGLVFFPPPPIPLCVCFFSCFLCFLLACSREVVSPESVVGILSPFPRTSSCRFPRRNLFLIGSPTMACNVVDLVQS